MKKGAENKAENCQELTKVLLLSDHSWLDIVDSICRMERLPPTH